MIWNDAKDSFKYEPEGGRSPVDIREALAPRGRLRAAINFGNSLLAQADPVTGEAGGISVALTRELAARLTLPVEIVRYTTAGSVVDALNRDEWDIGFLAIDPLRAELIDFTAPYIVIDGNYAVRQESLIENLSDVDRSGVRISLTRGSGYDLYLTRAIKHATLVRSATVSDAIKAFASWDCEVLASIKHSLMQYLDQTPGLRLIEPSFMSIKHALAIPNGRTEAAAYVSAFIEEVKTTKLVAARLNDATSKIA